MAQARSVLRTAVIALLVQACASSGTQTDVARAMCEKNISCANFHDDVEACTTRVAATMPISSCTSEELAACEDAINVETCTPPEAALPASCMVCD